jgi:hypothetical protein
MSMGSKGSPSDKDRLRGCREGLLTKERLQKVCRCRHAAVPEQASRELRARALAVRKPSLLTLGLPRTNHWTRIKSFREESASCYIPALLRTTCRTNCSSNLPENVAKSSHFIRIKHVRKHIAQASTNPTRIPVLPRHYISARKYTSQIILQNSTLWLSQHFVHRGLTILNLTYRTPPINHTTYCICIVY